MSKLLKKALFCLLALAVATVFCFYGGGDKNSGEQFVSKLSVPAQQMVAPKPPKGYGTIVIKGSF